MLATTGPAVYRNTHRENNPRSLDISDFDTCVRLAWVPALVLCTVLPPPISCWRITSIPEFVCTIFPMIPHADSCVFSKRSILHPAATRSLQKPFLNSSSRRTPVAAGTSLHIVVARITFGMACWPHKFANNFRFFSDDPAIRLSEILCR